MPPKNVDERTFDVLQLAQATINYTRRVIRYGSANQRADLDREERGGPGTRTEIDPRLDAVRDGVKTLIRRPRAPEPPLTDEEFVHGLSAGVTVFYGAGNCGEHADVAFCYLSSYGWPGLRVQACAGVTVDHAFVLLRHDDGPVVACDPWPSEAQAVLFEDHFCACIDYTVEAEAEVTPDTMGRDVMVDAFKAVDPQQVERLPGSNRIEPVSEATVRRMLRLTAKQGMYDHLHTTDGDETQEYVCGDRLLLSDDEVRREEWAAKLPRVLTDIGALGQRAGLDPRLSGL